MGSPTGAVNTRGCLQRRHLTFSYRHEPVLHFTTKSTCFVRLIPLSAKVWQPTANVSPTIGFTTAVQGKRLFYQNIGARCPNLQMAPAFDATNPASPSCLDLYGCNIFCSRLFLQPVEQKKISRTRLVNMDRRYHKRRPLVKSVSQHAILFNLRVYVCEVILLYDDRPRSWTLFWVKFVVMNPLSSRSVRKMSRLTTQKRISSF